MHIVLFNSETDGSLTLTTDRQGRPVLRIQGAPKVRDGDYAPSDLLGEPPSAFRAAGVVYDWALGRCRSDAGIAAAQSYLRQWPAGPQAETEDLARSRAATDALHAAARRLPTDGPTLDQMTPEQLRDQIRTLARQLADEAPEGATASLLRVRIELAATLLYGCYFRASRPLE